MNVQSACYSESHLELLIDGHRAVAGTKGTILGMGACVLLDMAGEDYFETHAVAEIPAVPPYYPEPIRLEGATTDPVVVVLARRAWDAADQGPWTPGPVPIPTLEEARAEMGRWHPLGWFFGEGRAEIIQ